MPWRKAAARLKPPSFRMTLAAFQRQQQRCHLHCIRSRELNLQCGCFSGSTTKCVPELGRGRLGRHCGKCASQTQAALTARCCAGVKMEHYDILAHACLRTLEVHFFRAAQISSLSRALPAAESLHLYVWLVSNTAL